MKRDNLLLGYLAFFYVMNGWRHGSIDEKPFEFRYTRDSFACL
jgi:hypothetical protein